MSIRFASVYLTGAAGWESSAWTVAGGLGAVAVALIALGIGLAIMRKMMALAKCVIALGLLVIVAAVVTAATLIGAF